MKPLLPYIRPYTGRMLLGFCIKFSGTLLDLAIPWVLSHLLETVIATRNLPLIFRWGFFMVFCSAAALITNIIANRMAVAVSRDITKTLRRDLFRRIITLSSRQIDTFTIPSLESRLTSDSYTINQTLNMMQRIGVRAPILLVGGIGITMMIDPVLSLVMVSVLPVITTIVWLISRRGIPMFGRVQKSMDQMARIVRENIAGIRVIKALSRADLERSRFDEINRNTVRRETAATLTMGLTNPFMNFSLNFGMVLVILVGAFRVNAGTGSPASIIAFLTYFYIILNAMLTVTRIFISYSKASASAARIQEVLNTPDDLVPVPAPPVNETSHIVFDDVCFSYLGSTENLSHISFRLEPGETLGIIGATGSGKSSVIQLLTRMYDKTSGSIRISGREISSIPPEELHTKFGIVFQNDVLFAGTVRENIDFGRDLSDAAIQAAVCCAQARDFIEALPGQLEHRIASKGADLSGGQKQRILLARALAGRPEILILDDSSSALDYRTDALLRQALDRDFHGVTTVIVAQRISSILHADHIMVLDRGRIIGYGSHRQLLDSCPVYREIRESQMGGAL